MPPMAAGVAGVAGAAAAGPSGQRVYLRSSVLPLVEPGLEKDVMDLQMAHLSEHAGLERERAVAPVKGLSHAGQQVEHRVEAGA
jgi:hypothetical protein